MLACLGPSSHHCAGWQHQWLSLLSKQPPCTALGCTAHRRRSAASTADARSCLGKNAGDHRHVSTLFAHFEAAAAAKHEHLMQMHAAALIQSIRMHSQVGRFGGEALHTTLCRLGRRS